VSGQHHAPAALYPRGKSPRYPLYRRLHRQEYEPSFSTVGSADNLYRFPVIRREAALKDELGGTENHNFAGNTIRRIYFDRGGKGEVHILAGRGRLVCSGGVVEIYVSSKRERLSLAE
jgi:hypothetical protein